MALYAMGALDYVLATDAEKGGNFWCIECGLSVKLRKGKYFPHFYHIQSSPACRLYSKSEDHFLIELQLKNFLPRGEVSIEHPFLKINRVADLYWEKEGIVFEIQCSPLTLTEAAKRVADYKKVGCNIIWLLDDRIFNRRTSRLPESFIRQSGGYYFSFKRGSPCSFFYDQFEIIIDTKRVRKGGKIGIDLRFPQKTPLFDIPKNLPTCILERISNNSLYIEGDLLDKTVKSLNDPRYSLGISRWKEIEDELKRKLKGSPIKQFLKKRILYPYISWLTRKIEEISD